MTKTQVRMLPEGSDGAPPLHSSSSPVSRWTKPWGNPEATEPKVAAFLPVFLEKRNTVWYIRNLQFGSVGVPSLALVCNLEPGSFPGWSQFTRELSVDDMGYRRERRARSYRDTPSSPPSPVSRGRSVPVEMMPEWVSVTEWKIFVVRAVGQQRAPAEWPGVPGRRK